jgi:HEAT repeat protein
MMSGIVALRSSLFFGVEPDIGESEEAQKIQKCQQEAFENYRSIRALEPHLAVLSPKAFLAVHAQWPNVCEEMFEVLAERFPEDLLSLISNDTLASSALTFAAEAAGRIPDGAAVRATLMPLLGHASAIVREGAIYGLRGHFNEAVSVKLSELAQRDPSPAIRQAASDTLDELCESH